jgi:hypothetical protein
MSVCSVVGYVLLFQDGVSSFAPADSASRYQFVTFRRVTTTDDLAPLFVLNASAVNALSATANATAPAAIAASGVRASLVRAYISSTAYADDHLVSMEVEELKTTRVAAALAAATMLLVVTPGQASAAIGWGTLTAYTGSVAQGAGYGDWRIARGSGSATAYFNGNLRDYRNGDESIYYSTQVSTNCANPSCVTANVGTGSLRDRRSGGSSVYVHMRTLVNSLPCITPPGVSCGGESWGTAGFVDSSRTNSGAWFSIRTETGVSGAASSARGRFQTCEDRRFAPDACSGQSFSGADTY